MILRFTNGLHLDSARAIATVEPATLQIACNRLHSPAGLWSQQIMATYDEELRSIKHPKLIDYKKEFSQEDIQKLIG